MKTHRKTTRLCFIALMISFYGWSQGFDVATIKAELKAATSTEQAAFKKGDCDQVLAMMSEEITFLANGRSIPSKQVVGKFCNSLPRPFKKASTSKVEIYPLSETTGYVVRTLEYPKDEKTMMSEFVTKIWSKADGRWKITHLHSTIKEVPKS